MFLNSWKKDPHGVSPIVQEGDSSTIQITGQLVNVCLKLCKCWWMKWIHGYFVASQCIYDFLKNSRLLTETAKIYFCQVHITLSPSLHSRATRDSRLSICICSLFKVRSLSRDLRLYAMSTTTMTRMSMAPAAAMLIIAVLLRGLSDVMWTTPGENSMPPTRAL